MEYSIPWRRTAIVASGIAALELAGLAVLALPALGRTVAEEVKTAAVERVLAPVPKPDRVAKTAPALPRGETSVIVLNGNGLTGAAGEAGRRVRGLGYLVTGTANAPRSDYRRSLVLYRPGRKAEAQRLARDLHVKVVGPLDGLRKRDLMGAHLALILGST